jgi:ferrous iron transport protein A
MSFSTLDHLPLGRSARIIRVDWDRLHPDEARRLRELGLDEGVEIEALHRGSLFARDPLAVRIGRLRFVMRASHAAAISVGALDAAAIEVASGAAA